MVDSLSPLDVSFLYFEESRTPMHVGSVAIFEPVDGHTVDYEGLVRLIEDRISLVPRYRQRVHRVPGNLASPVWVDDEAFDVTFHVRRSALPRPGTEEQLDELVGRVMSRPLDKARPLWEMYLVEGLAGGRFAVITKTHHAMVDGIGAVEIGQVILDVTPEPRDIPADEWVPHRPPSDLELVTHALGQLALRPTAVVDLARRAVLDVRRTTARIGGVFAAARTMARQAPPSPLNVAIGEQRRFARVDTSLDDYRHIRKAHGGTVNDVVLAVVSGALRSWLMTRGEAVRSSTVVRAMVPVSVRRPGIGDDIAGNQIAALLVDLPVGEISPAVRLHRVGYAMRAHQESGQSVAAQALAGIAGFAPPTLHALGARVAAGLSRRLFNLVVTNVPGPQRPLYAAGARLVRAYPVVPLAPGQALAIGVTSYDGGVYYGLWADRDAMSDLGVLAQCLEDSLTELLETV
ncbi:MAG TPA: wax ester/triacylglycerol synthase family O-acyltransferase [Actinomycetes bacterium]|nr:wax ester/triacylglycerol synthase family O-acyltransferase [Actinomycetes bacterium]